MPRRPRGRTVPEAAWGVDTGTARPAKKAAQTWARKPHRRQPGSRKGRQQDMVRRLGTRGARIASMTFERLWPPRRRAGRGPGAGRASAGQSPRRRRPSTGCIRGAVAEETSSIDRMHPGPSPLRLVPHVRVQAQLVHERVDQEGRKPVTGLLLGRDEPGDALRPEGVGRHARVRRVLRLLIARSGARAAESSPRPAWTHPPLRSEHPRASHPSPRHSNLPPHRPTRAIS
ncbi:hypothetical protein M885DRAFT_135266 [Pelagophyceae sp. CCMP2097]|nr:hypothetical protein M885DRAFT_135266 [Pelagophyceae sp. CCMP2097]